MFFIYKSPTIGTLLIPLKHTHNHRRIMNNIPLPFGEVGVVGIVHEVGGLAFFVASVVGVESVIELESAVAEFVGGGSGFVLILDLAGEDVTDLCSARHEGCHIATVRAF